MEWKITITKSYLPQLLKMEIMNTLPRQYIHSQPGKNQTNPRYKTDRRKVFSLIIRK